MQPISRRVPGYGGLSLHVLQWSSEGPPLLLVHGFGHSARIWDPFAPALAERYRVLALDVRGHGDSAHDPEFRYGHAAVARDLESAADALKLERLALVAHSLGGYAAIRFAARQPQRVEELVLVDAGPELSAASRAGRGEERVAATAEGYADPGEYTELLARMYPRARRETLARLAGHWLRRRPDGRYAPRLDPAFLRPKGSGDPEQRRSFDRARWAREESERLWGYLEKIPCPVLVVRGERSPMLSAETARRMVDGCLADARAVEIAGAGHAVMLDAPDALQRALLGFLGAGSGRRGGRA